MQTATSRKWTATIEIAGTVLDATPAAADLKADQIRQAIADVEALGEEDASIEIYKTTAKGTVRDRSLTVYRDPRTGQIRAL